MRKFLVVAVAASLLILSAAPANAGAPNEAAIKAEIDAYIVAHPMDFEAIDALVVRYRGQHITIRTPGIDRVLTATEAAQLVKARSSSDVGILSGIPAPQIYITNVPISGGAQFWGTWDFPDTWAGQGAPVDIAAQTFSTDPCTRMQNGAIWTYKVTGGQTYLGSTRSTAPNANWVWNVADYVTGFENQADRGTTRVEIVRSLACGPGLINVGAAFDYEGNQGSGSILGISIQFGFFSVTYSGSMLSGHWGTDPLYVYI